MTPKPMPNYYLTKKSEKRFTNGSPSLRVC